MPFLYVVHPLGTQFFKFGICVDWNQRIAAYKTAYPRFNHHVFPFEKPKKVESALSAELKVRECLYAHESGRDAETAACGPDNDNLWFALRFVEKLQAAGGSEVEDAGSTSDALEGSDESDHVVQEAEDDEEEGFECTHGNVARLARETMRDEYAYLGGKRGWFRKNPELGGDNWTQLPEPDLHITGILSGPVFEGLNERLSGLSGKAKANMKKAMAAVDSVRFKASVIKELMAMYYVSDAEGWMRDNCGGNTSNPSNKLSEFLALSNEERIVEDNRGFKYRIEISKDPDTITYRSEFEKWYSLWAKEKFQNDEPSFGHYGFNSPHMRINYCLSCKKRGKTGCCEHYSRNNRGKKYAIEFMKLTVFQL